MSGPAKFSDTLAFFRSLLPSVLHDASTIKGSLTLEQKQLCANIFTYFLVEGKTYGSEIGERVRLVETDVWEDEGQGMKGRTVCEIEVTKDMCNIYGTLHGGCAAYLIDGCSSSSLITLGIVAGMDGSGMSQSMNIIWHNPARVGTKLGIVSTTVSIGGRIMTAQCEIWDKERKKLLVSAIHSKTNLPTSKLSKL